MFDVFQFDSNQDGPKLLLLGAVHGNEVAGPDVLKPMIQSFESGAIALDKGSVTIVPVCNPKAYEQDVRFVEKNLNRTVRPLDKPEFYEEHLAQKLIPLINDADYILDIHSTHVEGDPAFSFMDERNEACVKFAKSLGVDTLFVGWEDVFEGEDFSTEAYAISQGKVALTLECGYHKSSSAATVAQKAVDNAFSYLGMIEAVNETETEHYDIYRFVDKVMKEEGDVFQNAWRHMDAVSKGQPIYHKNNGNIITAQMDGYILIPDPNAEVGCELYYFGVKEKNVV